MRELIVSQNEAGQRMDKLLAKYLNKAPKSFIYKMLRKKNIVLNNKKADGSEKLQEKDSIKLYLSEDTINGFREEIKITVPVKSNKKTDALDVLYEDGQILLINKPVGMLSQKAKPQDVSLVEKIIQYLLEKSAITKESLELFRPSVCNRLDRNTSGIVIAAKTLPATQEMSRILKDRSVYKEYRCIVAGKMTEEQLLKGWLLKDEKTNTVRVYDKEQPNSDYICTEYFPLKTNGDYTLLKVHLITGRSHQIRAHLASTDHPLIGDTKYGDRKANDYFRRKFGLKNQLLHSGRLVFPELKGTVKELSGKTFLAPEPALFTEIEHELFK